MSKIKVESGKTYAPMAVISNAAEALAYYGARERAHADNVTRAAALTADLSRAEEQAGPDMDLSRVNGFGDDPGARIMEVHSQLAGIERAIFMHISAEATATRETEKAAAIVARNAGGAGGLPGPASGAARMSRGRELAQGRTNRILAAVSPQVAEGEEYNADALRVLANGGGFQHTDKLPRGLRSHEIRAALFDTGDWDPFYTREPGYVPAVTRPIQILDILPMAQTGTDTVAYMAETTYTPAAASMAEGGTAAEAAYALTESTEQIKRIGHQIPVTEDALADEGQTRQYLDFVMPFGVMQAFDAQVLLGDPGTTATDVAGILEKTGVQTKTFLKVGSTTVIKQPFHSLKQAKTQVRVTGRAMPTHAILHPELWDELSLAETSAGGFYLGRPSDEFAPRVWGMPVIESDHLSFAAGKDMGLISDLTGLYTTLYIREGVSTQIGTSGTQFGEWKLTIRSRVRAALVIRRAASHCKLIKAT